jgi:hypothetical protein
MIVDSEGHPMTIKNGLGNVGGTGMAVASNGGVYVTGDTYDTNDSGEVVIYAPQKTKPKRVISQERVNTYGVSVYP